MKLSPPLTVKAVQANSTTCTPCHTSPAFNSSQPLRTCLHCLGVYIPLKLPTSPLPKHSGFKVADILSELSTFASLALRHSEGVGARIRHAKGVD